MSRASVYQLKNVSNFYINQFRQRLNQLGDTRANSRLERDSRSRHTLLDRAHAVARETVLTGLGQPTIDNDLATAKEEALAALTRWRDLAADAADDPAAKFAADDRDPENLLSQIGRLLTAFNAAMVSRVDAQLPVELARSALGREYLAVQDQCGQVPAATSAAALKRSEKQAVLKFTAALPPETIPSLVQAALQAHG